MSNDIITTTTSAAADISKNIQIDDIYYSIVETNTLLHIITGFIIGVSIAYLFYRILERFSM